MKVFYVWLTCPSDTNFDAIVASLLKRGYTVGPLGRSLSLSYVDKPALVVAMSLSRQPHGEPEEKEYTPAGIHDEVMNVVKVSKSRIYSIIVSESAACTWNVGNMSIAQIELEELKKNNGVN